MRSKILQKTIVFCKAVTDHDTATDNHAATAYSTRKSKQSGKKRTEDIQRHIIEPWAKLNITSTQKTQITHNLAEMIMSVCYTVVTDTMRENTEKPWKQQ